MSEFLKTGKEYHKKEDPAYLLMEKKMGVEERRSIRGKQEKRIVVTVFYVTIKVSMLRSGC